MMAIHQLLTSQGFSLFFLRLSAPCLDSLTQQSHPQQGVALASRLSTVQSLQVGRYKIRQSSMLPAHLLTSALAAGMASHIKPVPALQLKSVAGYDVLFLR